MSMSVRLLPPIHQLQRHEQFRLLQQEYECSAELLTDVVSAAVQQIRSSLLAEAAPSAEVLPLTEESLIGSIFAKAKETLAKQYSYQLRHVLNATGTVLHTNLGRACLSEAAIAHVVETARGYSNLEYKLDEGERGSRHDIVERVLLQMTGAEAAMVVNNNAAAVYMILHAFAQGKDVIVSRGQLVEIGGSFRVSSIMDESGARLREVGTTNRTHLYDYERVICDETRMIMKVHTSNFKVVGFAHTVESDELIALARRHEQIIYYEDLGSGMLYDLRQHGIGEEPLVQEVVAQGADIVSFSGDKLLGGPQAGIIVGRKSLINKLKKHPLARVLRVDKMTLAALEATLLQFAKGVESAKQIPTLRHILDSPEAVYERAAALANELKSYGIQGTVIREEAPIGGGTLPDVLLPTYAVMLEAKHSNNLQEALRLGTPSIVCRARHGALLFDLRAITDAQVPQLAQGITQAINNLKK
ncbi:L-seryl-tRNA(Sec) selenium transferase [Brevibacillus ginsengisoli]|uniref:L-seryl-tRNA(Sec) selenium transferase n=1 Tax=Brevibacillus ginsengisoli TaxID=363854 RepID=UPI003CE868A0